MQLTSRCRVSVGDGSGDGEGEEVGDASRGGVRGAQWIWLSLLIRCGIVIFYL